MKVPRPKPLIDVEQVRRLHLEEGLGLSEIGRRLGYNGTSIGRALRRAGIKIPRGRPVVTTDKDRRLHGIWRSIVGRCTRSPAVSGFSPARPPISV